MKMANKSVHYRVGHGACVAREKRLGFVKKERYFCHFKTCHLVEFRWFDELFMKLWGPFNSKV